MGVLQPQATGRVQQQLRPWPLPCPGTGLEEAGVPLVATGVPRVVQPGLPAGAQAWVPYADGRAWVPSPPTTASPGWAHVLAPTSSNVPDLSKSAFLSLKRGPAGPWRGGQRTPRRCSHAACTEPRRQGWRVVMPLWSSLLSSRSPPLSDPGLWRIEAPGWWPLVTVLMAATPSLAQGDSELLAPGPQDSPRPALPCHKISVSNIDFAFGLCRRLALAAPGQNVLFSPASISLALATVSPGAPAAGRTQLLEGLGFKLTLMSEAEIQGAFQDLLLGSPRRGPACS